MDTRLRTVPTFTFYQSNEDGIEQPINVCFYNGTITLEQNNNEVLIMPSELKALFKAIQKHQPEAEHWLSKK